MAQIKTKLAELAFLYCVEFVRNPTGMIHFYWHSLNEVDSIGQCGEVGETLMHNQ